MLRKSFHYRFIIDRSFFNEVMLSDGEPIPAIFHALMTITINSKEYKKEHNLISEKIRLDIIAAHPKIKPEYIKSSLNKVNEPESIEEIEDEIVRNIKYAIEYSKAEDNRIRNVCILTGNSVKDRYLQNQHLEGIKNVTVKSGDEAIALLSEYKEFAWDRN